MANAYVYQADLVCEKCARDLKRALADTGKEDTGDSADWPQGPFSNGGGEADSPSHCGSARDCIDRLDLGSNVVVGNWLENPLTNEGLEYVASVLANQFHSPYANKQRLANFWRIAYRDELMDWLAGRLIRLETSTDPKMKQFMDADYEYSVDLTPNLQGTNTMSRWSLDSESGHPTDPKLIEVPEMVMKSSSPEKMLREAIDEGAFD